MKYKVRPRRCVALRAEAKIRGNGPSTGLVLFAESYPQALQQPFLELSITSGASNNPPLIASIAKVPHPLDLPKQPHITHLFIDYML
jgi:hypothetical protein